MVCDRGVGTGLADPTTAEPITVLLPIFSFSFQTIDLQSNTYMSHLVAVRREMDSFKNAELFKTFILAFLDH